MNSLVAVQIGAAGLLLGLFGSVAAAPQSSREIPPAYGSGINPAPKDFSGAKSFKSTDRIVGTYYFYWYNVYTKEHIVNGDGSDALTDHPASMEDFAYTSSRWHTQQLNDMTTAGIDVVLPVFWGAPSEQDKHAGLHWSYAGLPPLIQAREDLVREGKRPPRIGLFYDTSTLQWNAWHEHIDLTTDFGKRWFYATVRDFFSMIPPKHWAMIDDRPLVLMYAAAFAKNYDQGFIDFTRQQFPKDFAGHVPYLVRQNSWHVSADNTCAWAGGLGLQNPGVASLGPGYDHSAVPGRAPLIVPREGGKFYEGNWLKFLRHPSNLVMLETWNEFHEGTDIGDSREYGRHYLELTRKYTDLFKHGWKPAWPKGKYTGAKSVTIALGSQNRSAGLRQVDNDDGLTVPATMDGHETRTLQTTPAGGRYIYFIVDDSFKQAPSLNGKLRIDLFDAAPGSLAVEYDGNDVSAPFSGAYTRSPDVAPMTGGKTWHAAEFRLPAARFLNSQNRGADFRLVLSAPGIYVRRVTLTRN
jgi:hypothetical protein